MKLLLLGMRLRSPAVLEHVGLPCLRVLQSLLRPPPPGSKKNRDKTSDTLPTVRPQSTRLYANIRGWLKGDPRTSYKNWKTSIPAKGK